jgi:hypothetical protein
MANNGAHPPINKPTAKSKKVFCYKDNELVATYDGIMIASRATGVKFQNIHKTCNGYKTTLNGYTFTFTEL